MDDLAVAVYTIVDAADDGMNVVYTDSEYFAFTVPYVSSLFAFREINPLVRLIDNNGNFVQKCRHGRFYVMVSGEEGNLAT